MSNTVRAFTYGIHGSGAHVAIAREPLSPGCMSDREVDEVIRNLKDDLDRVGAEMKKAIERETTKLLFEAPDA